MAKDDLLATLVAPEGQGLDDAHIRAFVETVRALGGEMAGDGVAPDRPARAADILFRDDWAAMRDDPRWRTARAAFAFDFLIRPAAQGQKKLLIADMESTIIEQEMLDELARDIGIGDKVASITARAMNGELDFEAALIERVGLLKGGPVATLERMAGGMTLMPGAEALLRAMRAAGGKSWLVSGGFNYFIKKVADRLGFDAFFGNELIVENGAVSGEVGRPILGKDSKKERLIAACDTYACSPAQAIAVGDGANDVPMLLHCQDQGGLGVAFRAKPAVREKVFNQINYGGLDVLAFAVARPVYFGSATA